MRSAVIEIGPTTTRAVVADPAPGGTLAIRLDRRIVLRLGQATERTGSIDEGLRLLVVETVQRLQTECLRAGVGRARVVVAADLAVADIDERLVRVVDRVGDRVVVRRRGGPLTLGRDGG